MYADKKESGYTGINKVTLVGGLLMLVGLANMPNNTPVPAVVEPQYVSVATQPVMVHSASLSSRRSTSNLRSKVATPVYSRNSRSNQHVVAAAAPARKFFVGGNWKCNGCEKQLDELITILNTADVAGTADVAICPPSVYIPMTVQKLRKDFNVCSQDVSIHDKGAYTGDIAADMLKDIGVSHTLVGHSERRLFHKETNTAVALKAKKALEANLKVIACIGETREERNSGHTMDVLFAQLAPMTDLLESAEWDKTVIAYEPVWAIGTGVTATSAQAQEVHAGIREWMIEHVGSKIANKVRIIYGGSVSDKNAKELGAQTDIDGFLVGGASLQPAFVDIINAEPKDGEEAEESIDEEPIP